MDALQVMLYREKGFAESVSNWWGHLTYSWDFMAYVGNDVVKGYSAKNLTNHIFDKTSGGLFGVTLVDASSWIDKNSYELVDDGTELYKVFRKKVSAGVESGIVERLEDYYDVEIFR